MGTDGDGNRRRRAAARPRPALPSPRGISGRARHVRAAEMPVRRLLGGVRLPLRDLPTSVGCGNPASRGARGDTPALLSLPSPPPGPSLTAAAGPAPWGGWHLPRRAWALRPTPALPRASAELLPAGAWAAGPGSAGSCPCGSLGARPAGAGWRGSGWAREKRGAWLAAGGRSCCALAGCAALPLHGRGSSVLQCRCQQCERKAFRFSC